MIIAFFDKNHLFIHSLSMIIGDDNLLVKILNLLRPHPLFPAMRPVSAMLGSVPYILYRWFMNSCIYLQLAIVLIFLKD